MKAWIVQREQFQRDPVRADGVVVEYKIGDIIGYFCAFRCEAYNRAMDSIPPTVMTLDDPTPASALAMHELYAFVALVTAVAVLITTINWSRQASAASWITLATFTVSGALAINLLGWMAQDGRPLTTVLIGIAVVVAMIAMAIAILGARRAT